MNDIELRKEMFAWYGAAMYAAQLFEVELVILLLALKRLRDPESEPSDYKSLDEMLSRKTLGNKPKKPLRLQDTFLTSKTTI